MTSINEMLCTKCGNIYIFCCGSKFGEKLLSNKILYCYKCQRDTSHIYIKNKDFMKGLLYQKITQGDCLTDKQELVLNLLEPETDKSLKVKKK